MVGVFTCVEADDESKSQKSPVGKQNESQVSKCFFFFEQVSTCHFRIINLAPAICGGRCDMDL